MLFTAFKSLANLIEWKQYKAILPLLNERNSLGSPESPPGYKFERCDTGGKYPFPDPPHFCTCDYAHVPVENNVNIKNSMRLFHYKNSAKIPHASVKEKKKKIIIIHPQNKKWSNRLHLCFPCTKMEG